MFRKLNTQNLTFQFITQRLQLYNTIHQRPKHYSPTSNYSTLSSNQFITNSITTFNNVSVLNHHYRRHHQTQFLLSSDYRHGSTMINNNGTHPQHQQQQYDKSMKAKSFATRSELNNAQRIVVKLGSAVITREDGCGLALGRLASIVEQTSQLHKEGRDVLMVTSGAVAFGKQKLSSELKLSMSMRETLAQNEAREARVGSLLEPRAAAAVGQSGLMALYEAMFSQYGISIAQVLVNKADFSNPVSRHNLVSTLYELLRLDIIPIVNTNDAILSLTVNPPPVLPNNNNNNNNNNNESVAINIQDNDSLAALLAVEVGADALFLMSDVDGIYTRPPSQDGARLLHTYDPTSHETIIFGEKSRVGLGGMDSKVASATWALDQGVSVVICNGMEDDAISKIMAGKKVGTFFTQFEDRSISAQIMAHNG